VSRSRVTRVVCAADAGGSAEGLDRLVEVVDEGAAQAVALVGDLSDGCRGTASRAAMRT
jgi:hypothetical protein